jgi:hypothetical protein
MNYKKLVKDLIKQNRILKKRTASQRIKITDLKETNKWFRSLP